MARAKSKTRVTAISRVVASCVSNDNLCTPCDSAGRRASQLVSSANSGTSVGLTTRSGAANGGLKLSALIAKYEAARNCACGTSDVFGRLADRFSRRGGREKGHGQRGGRNFVAKNWCRHVGDANNKLAWLLCVPFFSDSVGLSCKNAELFLGRPGPQVLFHLLLMISG